MKSPTVCLVLWSGLAAVLGCGAAQRPASAADEPQGTTEEYAGRIEDLRVRLDLALGHPPTRLAPGESDVLYEMEPDVEYMQRPPADPAVGAEPDCDLASDLRNRLCELTGRVCRDAFKQAGDVELRARCDRATTFCEEARRDVAVNCE